MHTLLHLSFAFCLLISLSFCVVIPSKLDEGSVSDSRIRSRENVAGKNELQHNLQRRGWLGSSKPVLPIPYNTRIKYAPLELPGAASNDLLDLQKWKTNNQDNKTPKKNEFQVKEEIGAGGQGTVWHVLWNDGNNYAAKVGNDIGQEIDILRIVERKLAVFPGAHENILAMKYAIHVEDRHDGYMSEFLVTELCERETAKDLVRKRFTPRPRTTEAVVKEVILQTTRGLKVLHDIGVFHLDIKPSNLFMRKAESGQMVIKIGDFGLARTEEWLDKEGGTKNYAAPEQYRHSQRSSGTFSTSQADIWALGMTMFELVGGELLEPLIFDKDHILRAAYLAQPKEFLQDLMVTDVYGNQNVYLSDDFVDLLVGMLRTELPIYNNVKRTSLEEVLEIMANIHVFYKNDRHTDSPLAPSTPDNGVSPGSWGISRLGQGFDDLDING